MAATHTEGQTLLLGQRLELGAENVEQFVHRKGFAIGIDLAVFQAGDVQQIADQILGRTQRTVEMLHQFLRLAAQAVVLVGEGGGEQSRGVQWLHQVMADRREKAGFRLVGSFGGALGFGQRDVELRQFLGSLADPLFQAFVGLGQRLFGFTERGDVGETHDEAATGHRIADQLNHPAVGEQPFGGVRAALTHPVQTTRDMHFRLAGTTQPALGVVANDVGDWPADADQTVRVVEQLQVTSVPGDKLQRLVDHADALGDVFNRALQQRAVELQDFRGFVSDSDDVLQLHFPAFDGGFYHRSRRRSAQDTGQQAFGMGDPFAVGVLVRVESLALAVGESNEALACTLLTDKPRRQLQQIVDLHRQHRPRTGPGADLLTDESPSLPVLRHPRTG